MPVYDLPDGSQDVGDHFVSVEAVNTGDQPIAITSWGIELPGDRRLFVTRAENWATPLPHVLAPGAPPARFLIRADELRRVEQEQRIPYEQMRPYVGLADGTVIQTAPFVTGQGVSSDRPHDDAVGARDELALVDAYRGVEALLELLVALNRLAVHFERPLIERGVDESGLEIREQLGSDRSG